jgi:malate synthase
MTGQGWNDLPEGVEILATGRPGDERILSAEALEFVAGLHRRFEDRRRELLVRRARVQQALLAGAEPGFPEETREVRSSDWQVAPIPEDLQDRRVEITGPVERKMMINALNSGARVFMADFEDALSPRWTNLLDGQHHLHDAVRRELSLETPEGKRYALAERTATLVVRPRGWHLPERHVRVDGEPMAGALWDFGLFFYHNARELLSRGSGPYLYLPKLESHLEARLWNDVFLWSQERLGLARGTIKATVLIETIMAAFEMDEILHELREHAAGLNAGRWDYIFSAIKKLRSRPGFVLPDRAQIGMTVPFMRAYTELLVRTCHRRGAHAMGGMSAFIPNRRDPSVTERALERVREDKQREATDGFDGTWVAHPDLVPVAMSEFDRVLGDRPHQKHRLREDVRVGPEDLLRLEVPGGAVTEAGVRDNLEVGIHYLESWLRGQGAVAIHDLMEDAATAEIARSQVWQWLHAPGLRLADGRPLDRELVRAWLPEAVARVCRELGAARCQEDRFELARALFERIALEDEYPEFLTLLAYEHLD